MTKRIIALARLAALAVVLTVSLTGVAQAAQTNYHFTLHTGNVENAGTDGDVAAYFTGSSGRTSSMVLLDDGADNYERNRYDRFDRLMQDVGTPTKLCIRFKAGWGLYSGWYLDWVTVNGKFFEFYRWFEGNETVCRSAA